jgi:hypothetical protein
VTPTPPTGQPNLHNIYQINFADQTAVGTYVLTVGPNVTDLSGVSMDQNENGAPNEPGVDSFTANFFINTRSPGNNPAVHPTPPVPGIVARVANSTDPSTPTNSLIVLVPSPTTALPNASPPRLTGFTTAIWGQLPPLPAGDTYVDGVTGDFTGDGKTDYAARDLNTGDWYVGLSNGNSFTVSKWGTWGSAPFLSWEDVRAGYFFGPNKPEGIAGLAVLRNTNGSIAAENWFIAQANGTTFTSTYAGSWLPENGFTWSDVVVGDFNGDGFDDIAARLNYPGSTANNAEIISVNDGTGSWVGKNASTLAPAYEVAGQWTINGDPSFNVVDVRVGDFNGAVSASGHRIDGLVGRFQLYGYVIVGTPTQHSNGIVTMDLEAAHPGVYWQTWSTAATWTDVVVGDFDGDGKDDLAARVLQNGAVYVSRNFNPARNYVTSPDGQQLWQIWNNAVTWVDTTVADFDGDGKADLISRVQQNGAWFISFADPSGTKFQTQVYAGGAGPALPASWSTNATYVNLHSLYQL